MRAASVGSHSTLTVCAGRPFFMTIGVIHASCAPGRQQRGHGEREDLAGRVVDVDLEQHAPAFRPRRRPTRSSLVDVADDDLHDVGPLGDVGRARPVADRVDRHRRVPHRRRWPTWSSAPHPSGWSPPTSSASPTLGAAASRSRATVAGAGLGRTPWALRIEPVPIAIGLQCTSSMSSDSSAAHTPTTSTIASSEPTSCSSTVGRVDPVDRALDRGQPLEHGPCPAADPVGDVGGVEQLEDLAHRPMRHVRGRVVVRSSCPWSSWSWSVASWVTTLAQVAPTPQRWTRSKRDRVAVDAEAGERRRDRRRGRLRRRRGRPRSCRRRHRLGS